MEITSKVRRNFRVSSSAIGRDLCLVLHNKAFALKNVEARIWSLCDGRPVYEIIQAITDEFDVSSDVAEADIMAFLESLESESLVSVKD